MDSMFTTCPSQPTVLMAGAACIVFSCFTPDEIRLFKTYRPEALQMKEADTEEPVFSLDLDEDGGPGSITDEGALFSEITSADGKATITVLVDPSAKERTELAEEKIGGALKRLTYLQELLKKQLPEVKQEQEIIRGWIGEL